MSNTETRKEELVQQLGAALESGVLDKQTCLVLRGRLGSADIFIHGRLGKLVLKRLSDHAYGRSKRIDEELRSALEAMVERLKHAPPRSITAGSFQQWFIYTDASFGTDDRCGGLGGVLIDINCHVVAWFGLVLDQDFCVSLGALEKGTIIYELELLAAVLAIDLWYDDNCTDFHVHYGEDDGVRFSLIRSCGTGNVAQCLMRYYVRLETKKCSQTWFARVPTEANISDFPSRQQALPELSEHTDVSSAAAKRLETILNETVRSGRLQLKRGKPDADLPQQRKGMPAAKLQL